MTLSDMIIAALAQLGRGTDAMTFDAFKEKFTRFANDAQNDLAEAVKPYRTDVALPVNGIVNLSDLPKNCIKILNTAQLGHPVRFVRGDSSNTILLPHDAPVAITYIFRPESLSNLSDISELDEALHGLIVTYIVGRERMAGDIPTQRGGRMYLAMYENAKSKLIKSIGDAASYRLANKY